jgi:uncharacterized protein YijF (DUF1287 family)
LPIFGIEDRGIFSDLDKGVFYPLPKGLNREHVHLLVNKEKRTLSLLYKGVPLKTYPIALGFSPKGHKQYRGDGKTPEGEYYICERLRDNLAARYGARSMRLSYPCTADADQGLKAGIVTKAERDAIEEAVTSGQTPPQNTRLGSSIRIHGGGVHGDWTAGCIALRDEDIIELYDNVTHGTRVIVTANGNTNVKDRDRDGIPDQVDIAVGAIKTALNGATYNGAYQKIKFPWGDVSREKGVCTDVIVRALRNAGIDLQEKIHRDITARRRAYPGIVQPNPSIDHRRVANMVPYMKRHMVSLPTDRDFLPGDIVLFDTLPKRGPDHIGIVSPITGPLGLPLVVNNWTHGATTAPMELLSWCPVTHHFRVK